MKERCLEIDIDAIEMTRDSESEFSAEENDQNSLGDFKVEMGAVSPDKNSQNNI